MQSTSAAKKATKLVDLACRKCGIIAFSGFVICSGPCGGCFHHHCAKLDPNSLNAITANTSIHWFCDECNVMDTINGIHRKLEQLTIQMEGFLSGWRRFCAPVLEEMRVHGPREQYSNAKTNVDGTRLDSLSLVANTADKINVGKRSKLPSPTAPTAKNDAVIIEDIVDDGVNIVTHSRSPLKAATVAPVTIPKAAPNPETNPKPKKASRKQHKVPQDLVSLTEAVAGEHRYQPKVVLEKLTLPILKNAISSAITSTAISTVATAASTSTSARSQINTEHTGTNRNRAASHVVSLRAALRGHPPIIGCGESLGTLRAADRNVGGRNKCLLVTNLDVACTTDDVLANLIAHCEATTDNVKVIKLSLRNSGSYGSFKVWCPAKIFEMALSPSLWPSGSIIREFIPMSKNWECPPPALDRDPSRIQRIATLSQQSK